MRWRFGGDLGANSFGWFAVELDEAGKPFRVLAAGSRIFSDGRDPKSKQSLAADRRAARSMRRLRDRFKQRQQGLLKHLTLAGLLPADETARKALAALDPYQLRARARHEPLSLEQIGRALFHLNQRRGFKSNRRTERKADDESGKIRIGVARLQQKMREVGAETLGEYLHHRRTSARDPNHIPSVRTRLRPETAEDAKGDGYDFYPDRAMLEEEFDSIWAAQADYHPSVLTDAAHDTLFGIVFHQRPLRAPRVGTCTLVATEPRLPKAHPLFQRRRLLEELNALRIVRTGENPQPLTRDQRDTLYLKLKDKRTVSFESLRKLLKLEPGDHFNKESENRKDLKGDEVNAEMSNKKRFGSQWFHLDVETQWGVIDRLLHEEDVETLCAWLEERCGLAPDHASAVAGARLPEGYGRFGLTATTKLIEALRADVIVYSEAVERAGLGHHSDFRTGEVLDALPYYGHVLERHIMPGTGDPNDPEEVRVGRLTNPTVHIGLNQVRRVLNRLIKAHGPPSEIALELARELKLDDKRKEELNRRNRENREAAEHRSKKLDELGVADKGGNRALLKLWEELNPQNALDRRCIYSGVQIGMDMLFSGAVEVDHILPFSDTLDDSQANKLLCLREANREKGDQSPFRAWGNTTRWDEIAERAARLPKAKRRRFEPDAMRRFEEEGGFLARHLVDTQYLSKLAREYLSALFPGRGEDSSKVWVSPGRLTEMLRRKWGLNDLLPDHNYAGGGDQAKNRLDHRHHTIDAAVIAVTDRGLLQRIATESGRSGSEGRERIIVPAPWEGFRDDLKLAINRVVVSHRSDHGTVSKAGLPKGHDATAGRLHNDTAYGLTGVKERGVDLVVHRVPLASLTPDELTDGGRRVADDTLRRALAAATAGREGKAFIEALTHFAASDPWFAGTRRVRVLEPLSVVQIRDAKGRVYKGYKRDSNYRYDIWEMTDGKWVAEVVSMFDAHQPGWVSELRRDNPTIRKILKLHRDDVLAIDRGSGRELMRVVKFSEKQFALAAPQEGGPLKARAAAKGDPFNYIYPAPSTLRAWGARQVRIDELGRVLDPGPRAPAATAA
ncbi:MAG TPA: type II CRISPR RNA-guided endonuclease Cas9 [Caulobacteraceae bacterium]